MKNKFSIGTKLLIPTSVVILLLIIIMFPIMKGLKNKNIKTQATVQAENVRNYFNATISASQQEALQISSSFAIMKDVKKAYSIDDINDSKHFIRTALSPEITHYKNLSGLGDDLKLHFHTKDLHSLWRSWKKQGDNDGGDDLSGSRNSIKDVVNTQKPIKTIEMGVSGFVIRGISPIISNGEYLGSVEAIFTIDKVNTQIKLNEDENLCIFSKIKNFNISAGINRYDSVGRYLIISEKKGVEINPELKDALRSYDETSMKFIKTGDVVQFLFPIYEYEGGDVIAVGCYSYNTEMIANSILSLQKTLLIFVLIGLFVIFGIIIIMGRIAITKPIQIINKDLKIISDGNLLHKMSYTKDDELGLLVKELSLTFASIRKVFTSVNKANGDLRRASEHLNYTSQDVSQGASEQAASVEEVSASMEQMSANIEQNVSNAKKTEKEVYMAAAAVFEGNKVVRKTTDLMKLVSEKIVVISEIAKQTNILALNASVESASAGEFGKGFSVIAKEIRQLAEDTQSAAVEIVKSTSSGVTSAEKAVSQLANIIKQMENSSEMIKQIVVASTEQKNGVDQVTNGIEQLNKITQQNAAVAEEMATSSEELAGQSEALAESISQYLFSDGKGLNEELLENEQEKGDGKVVAKEKVYKETQLISDDKPKIDDNTGFSINLGKSDLDNDNDFERF